MVIRSVHGHSKWPEYVAFGGADDCGDSGPGLNGSPYFVSRFQVSICNIETMASFCKGAQRCQHKIKTRARATLVPGVAWFRTGLHRSDLKDFRRVDKLRAFRRVPVVALPRLSAVALGKELRGRDGAIFDCDDVINTAHVSIHRRSQATASRATASRATASRATAYSRLLRGDFDRPGFGSSSVTATFLIGCPENSFHFGLVSSTSTMVAAAPCGGSGLGVVCQQAMQVQVWVSKDGSDTSS